MEFSSTSLGCKISVDKPSVDGYEVSNLITWSGNKGFVCESFVRPPINIKIDFPVPIDISSVTLQTQVGERKSTAFKISSLITTYNAEILLPSNKNCANDSSESVACASATDSHNSTESEECYLGKWFSISEKDAMFKNYHYKHWISYPLPQDATKSIECYTGALRSANRMAMKSVNSLIITIMNVRSTGPPVLKGIQVWGQPSINCSPSQKRKMFQLWTKHLKKQSSRCNHFPVIEYYDVKHPEEEGKNSPDMNVPDEFLDPLTCEIMKLPILLPSGNSIDSSSLERFISNEAMWGRSASDPFTGVSFKPSYQPEPNVHLKARIDRYILIEKNVPSSLMSERGHMVTDHCNESTQKSHSGSIATSEDHENISHHKKRKLTSIHSIPSLYLETDPQPRSSSSSSSVSTKDDKKNSGKSSAKSYHSNSTLPSTSVKSLSSTSTKSSNAVKSLSSTSTKSSNAVKSRSTPAMPTSANGGLNSSTRRNTGHSLIQSIGTALSSTSKKQSHVKARPTHTNSLNQTVNAKNTPLEQRPPKIPDQEKYSLLGLALNPLHCSCGNRVGVFYSLNCSHNICNACVKSLTKETDTVSCGKCGQTSRKHQLCRVHPQSAFAV